MNNNPHDHTHATSQSTADEAKKEAQKLHQDLASTASEAGARAAGAVRDKAEQAKDNVADEISSVGNALRRASEELRSGSPQERTFGQMAGTLADLSDNVRGKDLGEMVDDLSAFARRNPVAFLGGAALLGFAGVRMAKASKRDTHQDEQLPMAAPTVSPDATAAHTTSPTDRGFDRKPMGERA